MSERNKGVREKDGTFRGREMREGDETNTKQAE